jgi:hypothetical protein
VSTEDELRAEIASRDQRIRDLERFQSKCVDENVRLNGILGELVHSGMDARIQSTVDRTNRAEEAERLRGLGLSVAQVSVRLGVTKRTVSRYLAKKG